MELVAATRLGCGPEARVLAPSLGRGPGFALAFPGSDRRAAMESFIRHRFAAAHGAEIRHFLPALIGLGFARRQIAAVGVAHAADGPLFAETYFDEPIEALIERARGESVARGEVIEIGNLVSAWSGGGLLLFVFLSELLDLLGLRWAVFTATSEVERLLGHLGYAPTVLGDADPARLGDAAASWGRYYLRGPRVMFGEIPPAVALARGTMRYRALSRMVSGQVERVAREWLQRDALQLATGAK